MILSDDQIKALVLKTGLTNDASLQELVDFAKNSNVSLADALIEKDVISDENLGILVADFLHIPFIVLSKLSIPEDVFRIVPEKIARKHKVIPFEKTQEGLKVATVDPKKVEILQAISKKAGVKVIPYLTTERDVENILRIYKRDLQKSFEQLLQKELGITDISKVTDAAPIEKIVNLLVEFGYQDKVSDIHIEPEEKDSLVRFRIDGILHDVLYFPKNFHTSPSISLTPNQFSNNF